MDLEKYVDKRFGRVRRVPGAHGYHHYVPSTLPRSVDLSHDTVRALSEADRALGRLVGTGRLLPDANLLVGPTLTVEALASTQIEGTQTSLSEVLEAAVDDEESTDVDVREVQNHVAAAELGMRLLKELPLSLRLLRQVHERLLAGVRGSEKRPGELRTSQNWIGPPGATLGDATYVPPRADPEMLDALRDWERFLHDSVGTVPPLVAAALLHYQFETIHPFLDGNGRLGRLVVVLYLMHAGELPQPILALSPWFERDREAYYARLQGVRERGELEEWLQYFLTGVSRQATLTAARAERLTDLRDRYRRGLAGDRSNAIHVVELLLSNPFITTARVTRHLGVTSAGAINVIRRLEERGWLRELRTAGQGGRITWVGAEVLEILRGTDADR